LIGFVAFYRQVGDLVPDVILEAKAKDVAVGQLRKDLGRHAPDLAFVFGLYP
jgi:hypothetical protein